VGEDEGAGGDESDDGAGSIAVETLLSIRTVASLAIENMRSQEYAAAIKREDPSSVMTNLKKGFATGLGYFIQLWGQALMFWWGGWLQSNYPERYGFRAFLISMFALLFSLSGFSIALVGVTDQVKAKQAAGRIFALIDRESTINSLSKEGKKNL
jgi:ATP-binding cassette subfamily B (MDR/TAP) protein 1